MRSPYVRLSATLLVPWLCSCGLGKNAPPWDDPDAPGQPPHSASQLSTAPEAPRLSYGEIPQVTCATYVPIVGTAEPSSDVRVRGGSGGSFGATATSGGQFCVPVALSPNQNNVFEIRAFNQHGFGDMVTVTVRHDCAQVPGSDPRGTSPPLVPTNGSSANRTNVALGGRVTSKYPAKRGSLEAVTDGNPSSYAEFDSDEWSIIPNPLCLSTGSWDGWVMVSLDTLRELQAIKVVWRDSKSNDISLPPSKKMYGWRYSLWVSRVPGEPSEPNEADGQWTKVRHITDGDGGDDNFHFSQPLIARHIALTMELDGHCFPWGLNNIPYWWDLSWNEHFALSEIEAYAAVSTQTSAPPATEDVCLRASGLL